MNKDTAAHSEQRMVPAVTVTDRSGPPVPERPVPAEVAALEAEIRQGEDVRAIAIKIGHLYDAHTCAGQIADLRLQLAAARRRAATGGNGACPPDGAKRPLVEP